MTKMIYPSCSEAVFRFMATDPKDIQQILQAIKDSAFATYVEEEEAIKARIKELSKSEEKDERSKEILKALKNELKEMKGWVKGDMQPHTKIPLFKKAEMYDSNYIPTSRMENIKKFNQDSTVLSVCAGLGDNNAVITVEKDGFVLNIGNNDIQDGEWQSVVEELGIKVQEAELSEELTDLARDCTCGCRFFEGYKGLIKDPDFEDLLRQAGLNIRKDHKYDDPNRRDYDLLLYLFKIWRVGKEIKPHMTTVEHARRFLEEPIVGAMEKIIKKSEREHLIDDMEQDKERANNDPYRIRKFTDYETKRRLLVAKYSQKKSKSFSVSSKDLMDKKKNPKLSFAVEDVLKNPKIKKKEL